MVVLFSPMNYSIKHFASLLTPLFLLTGDHLKTGPCYRRLERAPRKTVLAQLPAGLCSLSASTELVDRVDLGSLDIFHEIPFQNAHFVWQQAVSQAEYREDISIIYRYAIHITPSIIHVFVILAWWEGSRDSGHSLHQTYQHMRCHTCAAQLEHCNPTRTVVPSKAGFL